MKNSTNNHRELTEHLFRIEYGKIVSVIGRYLGISNIKYAEDIAQETFYKAVISWQQKGIPENPEAWLYKVAKNKCLNLVKRETLGHTISKKLQQRRTSQDFDKKLDFSNNSIKDDQLRMMYACCHESISPKSQIALMLKILCGFSISEIALAFFSSNDTIRKRIKRAKTKLKNSGFSVDNISSVDSDTSLILQTIYLLFNEGYSPAAKNVILRKELCFQAIRLCEVIKENQKIKDKSKCYALLSVMYLNVSRFGARNTTTEDIIEMQNQDRSLWNQELIKKGLAYLNKTFISDNISKYHILATISANHCIATEYKNTDWKEILNLYNSLIVIDDSPLVRLNRSVAIAKAQNNHKAIEELKLLEKETDINKHHLFHSTIAEFYLNENKFALALDHLNIAISKAVNKRDIFVLRKKLADVVPN